MWSIQTDQIFSDVPEKGSVMSDGHTSQQCGGWNCLCGLGWKCFSVTTGGCVAQKHRTRLSCAARAGQSSDEQRTVRDMHCMHARCCDHVWLMVPLAVSRQLPQAGMLQIPSPGEPYLTKDLCDLQRENIKLAQNCTLELLSTCSCPLTLR